MTEKRTNENGYLLVEGTDTPAHRAIYRLKKGPIPKGWHVHHMDNCKLNNHPLNLVALPPGFHWYLHKTKRRKRNTEAKLIQMLIEWARRTKKKKKKKKWRNDVERKRA